uniref:SWIM-type domain-containing protein n=1 Tax=Panagrolaimus sp. ES5 TaxID=591445 RepID=A0AC34FRE3_9BILA
MEVIRQSHWLASFDQVLKVILSGREPMNAFSDLLKMTKCVSTINDTPSSRIDITFKDENICLSILKRHGNFGLRVIETALQYTPTLVCDRIQTWMRPAFKGALIVNRINLLEVLTMQNTAVTQIHAIAKTVKRLVDHSGKLIGNKTIGSYDFIYTKQINLAWTKIEIEENDFGFMQLESGFKNTNWKKNPKLQNIEKVIVEFTLHKSHKPFIQNLLNTFVTTFPNLKSLILEISYNCHCTSEIEKQHQGLPKKFTKVFSTFENVEVPEQMNEVKFNLQCHCTERIYTRESECPHQLRKAFESYKMITDEKKICQWQKNFDYGNKKSAKILLNVYLRRSPFAI